MDSVSVHELRPEAIIQAYWEQVIVREEQSIWLDKIIITLDKAA